VVIPEPPFQGLRQVRDLGRIRPRANSASTADAITAYVALLEAEAEASR
jgi:hypothetical protein